MTKNAKIAIIVAVVAFIALIVVLCSTIFSVKKAELVWYKEPNLALSQIDNNMILEKSEVKAQSVFFLDRNKAIASLEESYPEMRVIDIEVIWPNTMKVHATMREAVYALPVKNGFAIIDEYFKVLEVKSEYDSTKSNAVLLNNDSAKNLEVEKGDTIDLFGAPVLADIYYSFIEMERSLVDFRAIVKGVSLENTTLTISTHQGTIIKLDKPFANTRAKMRLALGVFDTLTTEDYADGVVEVFVNDDNELEARFYKI